MITYKAYQKNREHTAFHVSCPAIASQSDLRLGTDKPVCLSSYHYVQIYLLGICLRRFPQPVGNQNQTLKQKHIALLNRLVVEIRDVCCNNKTLIRSDVKLRAELGNTAMSFSKMIKIMPFSIYVDF